jgi:hypothetical protein
MRGALFFVGSLLAAGGCAPAKPLEVVCTMEAKTCPDGSYVGRNPAKNCEFDLCPKSSWSLVLADEDRGEAEQHAHAHHVGGGGEEDA